MKKLLVLLALLLALTLVFIACDKNKNPVTDTTVDDQTTEEPTQDVEDPTAAPTDPEETTEEPTQTPTEEQTTEAPTEKPTAKPEDPTEPPVTQEPETADPMEPVNVFGPEDIQTVTGGDPSNMTQDCLTLEDGYIHVVPIGPDPYWYPFAGVDGARYVAIRYRTDATGADIQMYIGSTGNGPTDDSTMLRQPVIADSEWHVAIFDTQSLIDAGKYDGEYVSYFRFDALEAGYILDENGQPYKPDGVNYARYTLPEGCSIDVAYIGFFHNEDAVAKYDFEQYPPYAQPGESGQKNVSFDTFYVNNQMYFPEDGGADAKLDAINNTLTFNAASELESIILRGWIGFDQPIDTFGYYVDNHEFVYGDYKKPTEDGVLAAGGEHATRFEIFVDLSYLEGDDHFVGFVVKLADGTIVQLREDITIDLPDLPKDITDSFVADVNANEVGTTMDATDLGGFFVTELPLPGSGVEANGEGKLYHLTSINDMYADVNGRYFFKANVLDSNGAGWMFARGYKVVNSDAIVAAFDPAGGFFKINNYYETDSAGAMGGAGIYARLGGGKLFIMVKHYNPDAITRVGNKIYAIDAVGTELTLADNGFTVSILVDGVTYATVDLSGSKVYEDINEVDPAGEFAATAVITLKDGTTETIENTLIAATCESQIGIVARAGSFKFDALAVGGYSAIDVPALEIETPEEPEPVDPDAPVLVLNPEYINELAGSTEQTVAQHIGSHEIITEDGVTFVRLTSNGGDPYVAIVKLGSYLELPPYMAFAYRTNCDLDAHVFIGSGSGWSGSGDVASVAWNQDNNWNLAVLDLNNAGLSSIQNGIISYCRFDFFTGNGAGNMDVEYVAFFNSAEAAQKYFDKLHGTDVPTEPEVTEPQEPETEEPKPEPEFYEDWTVDLSTLAGHLPNWDAAGYGTPIVKFGYNSVYDFGTVDFSKYSSIVIEYSYDGKNGDVATDFANSASAPGFGFSTVKGAFGYANVKNQEVYDNGVFGEIECDNTMMWATSIKTLVIDISELTYNGQVYLSAFNPWGREMVISSIKFIGAEKPVETEPQEPEVPSEPEFYENLVVPQDQWVITGHNTQLNDSTNGMVAAGGVESAALLHQGSIALGNIDLSKYSKVIVMWGCDNSQVTIDHYNANANNRIMLLNAEMSMVMSPAADTIIAGGTYELKGWKVTAFEIDLTGIDYNGPVWLAIDALPGTFALFASVEFVGAEKVDEPVHQHEYTTVVTDPTCTEGGYTTYTCACGDTYVADQTPAAGHNFVDGFCGICGEADPDYVAPVTMPAEFILSLYQANLGKTLYFKGAMSGYYFATSENINDAVKLYSEEVEGGYRMYFMDGETKTYLDIVYRDINKANVVLTTTPVGVYVWNEEANTWTVTIPEAESTFYLGTYNSYNTISASGVYYITGDNAANVGVTQFLAQWANVPAPHEHNYEYETIVIDPTCTEDGYTVHKCECGDGFIDTEIPAAGHNFVDGFCGICGEADPNFETPDEPDAPVAGGSADFNTIVTPNANGSSSYTGPYTTTDGWVINNSAIQAGGSTDINPQFTVIGPDNSFKAPCLNGKVSAPGSIESPVLSGGISKLVINYTKMFTDTKLGATITITDIATGAVYTNTLSKEADKNDKYTVWTFEWVLETPITGDFTIEIVNNSPSANTGNKDRLTILAVTWEGVAAEEPEAPAGNEIVVTTTDTYGYFDEYTFVATASGTYTFTLPAGLGFFTADAYAIYGAPVVDFYDNAEGYTFSVALVAGQEYKYLVGALTKGDWTITYTFVEGEVGGDEPETPDEPEIPALVLGENTIVVSDALYNEGGFLTTITIAEEGTYTFTSSNLMIRVMTDMGMAIGTAYLTPGTYEVQVVTAYLNGPCTTSVTVEFTAPEQPETPDPEQPGGSGEPDGTAENPYILTDINTELSFDGAHDVYYSFTSAGLIKINIFYTEGCLVSISGDAEWDKDEGAMMYTIVVFEGGTVILNPFANNGGTYTIIGGGKK